MTSTSLPPFQLPELIVNSAGWGPAAASNMTLKQFDGLPFQLYNKCDRVGRIVDWLGVERFYKKNETSSFYMV